MKTRIKEKEKSTRRINEYFKKRIDKVSDEVNWETQNNNSKIHGDGEGEREREAELHILTGEMICCGKNKNIEI